MRIARMNTGKAFGFSLVRAALDHFKKGRFETGHNLLKHMPLTTYGTPGAADIQGILRYDGLRFLTGTTPISIGRFLAIECKRPGEKQDDDQVKWQAMVERHGGLFILAYSVEDVWDVLNKEGFFPDSDFEVVE